MTVAPPTTTRLVAEREWGKGYDQLSIETTPKSYPTSCIEDLTASPRIKRTESPSGGCEGVTSPSAAAGFSQKE
jgi:hypothetical protein